MQATVVAPRNTTPEDHGFNAIGGVDIMDAEGDDATSLKARIEKQHGIHTVEHAEKIGLGSRKYKLVSIDGKE